MSFIGIMSEDRLSFEKILETVIQKTNTNNEFIILDENNIENMKNVKFETIVALDNVFRLKDKLPILEKILKNAKYLIINSDIKDNLEILGNLDLTVITCGFNSKATISVSSTEYSEKNMVLCIQRAIKDIKGKVIEPQEIKIEVKKMDIYHIIGLLTVSLIYRINLHFM